MRKITLFIVTAIWLFGNVFSASAYNFAVGDGSQNNPYQVETRADLAGLKDFIVTSDAGAASRGKYFIQTADIDLSTGTWSPIATSTSAPFCGNYNGNGYRLSGIVIDALCPTVSNNVNYHGVFGCIGAGATIENVHLEGGIISVSSDATHVGSAYVGSIAGYVYNIGGGNTVIRNCSNTATIINNAINSVYTGGIAGYIFSNNSDGSSILISNCYSNASIEATAGTTTTYFVGGIVGSPRILETSNTSGAITIEKCFAAGTINAGTTNTNSRAGGIVSRIQGSTSKNPGVQAITISNCVSALEKIETVGSMAGRVWASHTTNDSTITKSNYAYAAMLVKGVTTPSMSGTGTNGVDKTLAELQAQATYTALDWDFTQAWTIEEGVSFPQLKVGGRTGMQLPKVADALKVSASNGVLTIKGLVAGETVNVYNIRGQLVAKRKATGPEATVELPVSGIYLVSSGNQTVKAVNK